MCSDLGGRGGEPGEAEPPAREWRPPTADAEEPHEAYRAALERIYAYSAIPRSVSEQRLDRPRKVARIRRLLELVGAPQSRFDTILIAGTKGKGSTAALLASMLAAAGRRVGRYTQPHLLTWRERSWVDGRLISPEQVVARFTEMQSALAAMHRQEPTYGALTTFEVGTVLTLLHFAQCGVEVAILEAGVGGRHDATNAVDPIVSLVTSVSFDHTAVLGDTLAEIATEKAGVMRRGRPAVLGPQPPEALDALERNARVLGAPLQRVGSEWRWSADTQDVAAGPFTMSGPDGIRIEALQTPLLGRHQRENAIAAAAAAWVYLGEMRGAATSANHPDQRAAQSDALDAIRRGTAEVEWPGRLQVLGRAPTLIVDGAHNGDSARRLAEALKEAFRYRRLWLVLGLSAGKDVLGVLEPLAALADEIIVTRSSHQRALELEALAALAGRPVRLAENVTTALTSAYQQAFPDDLVCVTGSLFLVGEAMHVAPSIWGNA